MMFKKISLIASLLFFLLGTNVFANSHIASSSKNETKAPQKQAEAALLVKKTTNNQNSIAIYMVPGCITIVLVFGFGSYWLIYRRKLRKV